MDDNNDDDDEEQGFISPSSSSSSPSLGRRVSSFFTASTLSKRNTNSSLTTFKKCVQVVEDNGLPIIPVAIKKMIPSTECSNDDDDDNNNNNNKNKEERGQLLNDNDQGEEDTDAVDDNDDKDNDNDNASLLIKDHLSKIAEEEDGDVDDDDDNDDGDNENTGFIVSSKKKNTKKTKKLNHKNKNNTQRGNRNRNHTIKNKNNDVTNNNASTLHTKGADESSSGERKTGPFLSFFTTHDTNTFNNICYKTLFPDNKGIYVCGYPLLDHKNDLTTNQDDHHHQDQDPTTNNIPIKLLKFILLTFVMIGMVHVIVAALFNDRDRALTLRHIWVFEGDLIVRDCLVFFVVGRLYHPTSRGIDHLAWMGTAILANLYFESQNFVGFLQHSVSLYEIHCIWPWELWLFALLLIPTIGTVVLLHILKGYREHTLGIKITELLVCVFFFVAPMITSKYFHFHHWYAGWLLGMHANYNTWWSRMVMAWCWGMYVNGIAVYGRDPVLTCEYAYFLTIDNRCPYISCYLDALQDINQTAIKEMVPINWMNCSASDDYKP